MTLAVAFIHRDTIYLITDTAVTHKHTPASAVSSFGEATFSENGIAVEEGGAKVVTLTGTAAVACVGDSGAALGFLRVLRDVCMPDGGSLEQQLNDAANIRETKAGPEFSLLIGVRTQGVPRLLVFHSIAPEDVGTPAVIAYAGAGVGVLGDLIPRVIAEATKMSWSPAATLVNVIAYFQMLGVHHYLLEKGFGGAFYGGCLDGAGFQWMEDLTYLFYLPSLCEPSAVTEINNVEGWDPQPNPDAVMDGVCCRIRDDVLVLQSTISPTRTKYIGNSLTVPSTSAWRSRWEQELHQLGGNLQSRYFVWISKAAKVVVVFEQPVGRDGQHLRVVRREERGHFAMSKMALIRMRSTPDDPNLGKIWFFGESS